MPHPSTRPFSAVLGQPKIFNILAEFGIRFELSLELLLNIRVTIALVVCPEALNVTSSILGRTAVSP
jgi:hypothetical protein